MHTEVRAIGVLVCYSIVYASATLIYLTRVGLGIRIYILSYGCARSSAIAGPRTPPPRPRPSSSSHIHRRPCSPKPSHCVRGCLLGSRQHSATTPCDLSVVLASCVVFCFVPHRPSPPPVDIAHLLPALVATGVSLLSRSIWIGILQYQLPLLDMPS